MEIPVEVLSSSLFTWLGNDEALTVLPFLVNNNQRTYIKHLQSKRNIILRFIKEVYTKICKKGWNKKLSNFLKKDAEWFIEIVSSCDTFREYMKEVLGMFSDEFPQYNYLIADLNSYRRCMSSLNVKKTRVVMGTPIPHWDDDLGVILVNNTTTSRVFIPQYIHRIYPVKLTYARKIEKSPLLRGLLF